VLRMPSPDRHGHCKAQQTNQKHLVIYVGLYPAGRAQ
jgi:hypothetical protein